MRWEKGFAAKPSSVIIVVKFQEPGAFDKVK